MSGSEINNYSRYFAVFKAVLVTLVPLILFKSLPGLYASLEKESPAQYIAIGVFCVPIFLSYWNVYKKFK